MFEDTCEQYNILLGVNSFKSRQYKLSVFSHNSYSDVFSVSAILFVFKLAIGARIWVAFVYTAFPQLDAWASISKLCAACPASKRAQASI